MNDRVDAHIDQSPDDARSQFEQTDDMLPWIGRPAAQALDTIGVTKRHQLANFSESELLALHGFGPKAIRLLREAGVHLRDD